jgi:hypothetical protein
MTTYNSMHPHLAAFRLRLSSPATRASLFAGRGVAQACDVVQLLDCLPACRDDGFAPVVSTRLLPSVVVVGWLVGVCLCVCEICWLLYLVDMRVHSWCLQRIYYVYGTFACIQSYLSAL